MTKESLDYKDYIVSTSEAETFLHRTFRDCVDGILEKGLDTGAGELQSTATWQPHELDRAEGLYRAGRDHGDSVVVIQIPAVIWTSVRQRVESRGSEVADERIGYMPNGHGFTVRPEFMVGWINRDTNKVTPKGDKK